MNSVAIYGLYDRDGKLRYIGKAARPDARLKSHMRDCRRRDTPLYSWIRKHGCPEMRILETDCADWKSSERRWIAEARQRGERLLNLAEGGDQPFCPTEVRIANGKKVAIARVSDPAKARMYKAKRNLGDAIRRGHVSEETKDKIRAAAIIFPQHFGQWANIR